MNLKRYLGVAVVAVALASYSLHSWAAEQDAGRFSWRQEAGTVALLEDGKTTWQFNYSPELTNAYFSPVAVAGGPDLTWLSPKDHPYHFALFFCWKYLNGVNYWEARPEGITTWSNVRVQTRPDFSAAIAMDLQYRPRQAVRDVLTEKRAVRISPPAADGSYFMDWQLQFTAGDQAVVMDRTPPDTAPDGNPRGGYAGLSVRLSREMKEALISATGDVGPRAKNRHGFAASAAEFSGEIDGAAGAIAILDHPANPRTPTRWYAIVDPSVPFWFLNASWLQLEPYTLGAGQVLTLRYRVFIHPGRWDAARLEQEQARFARQVDRDTPLQRQAQ